LYVLKYVITIWFTWLKMNHIGYKNTIMNMDVLNTLHENGVLEPIMISMWNRQILNLQVPNIVQISHQQKKNNEIEHVIKTLGLIHFNGIDINQHKQMINAFKNLHHNQYLSYNHQITMISEYNNLDLIGCRFLILFLLELVSSKWITTDQNIITNSYKPFKKIGWNLLFVFKQHLFPFFVFNII
jgi:hypothetical protein